ncbi:thioester reductase domain-containing protein [Candidatus Protochlamydia sp. W-9]|uniref:thioester reductase domain-containing protein n=1 Tax=Candidatus Protochlamydia sp. W-9 TaxID=1785087 RepID=UPI00096A7ABE|nr:thioester reductase domain-containing protein [Candidatus Protochlamydia sp. W-9]
MVNEYENDKSERTTYDFSLENNLQNLNLFEQESVLMNRAIQKIINRCNLNITIEDMLKRPTIRNLAKFFEGDLQFLKMSQELIKKDLENTGFWFPSSVIEQTAPNKLKTVLVTGGSGFLGSHLIKNLCELTKAKILVLVRASNILEAEVSLKNSIIKFKLDNLFETKQIVPLLGDLSKPFLGLNEKQFEILSYEIDAIYHLGASVHHIYDYQTLRSTNVLSTCELIKLAMLNKKKIFNYVSSVVAALERDKEGLVLEEFPNNNFCYEIDGYSQTKWVSEKLLTAAYKQGLPVTIFRPCNITGRSKDGVCSYEKNHLLSLIKGCIQMGVAPDWPIELNIMPVDLVSVCIAKASLCSNSRNKIFNIVNRNRLSWLQFIEWLKHYGYKIKVIPEAEWSGKHLSKITKNNALFHLACLYVNEPDSFQANSQMEYTIENYHDENSFKIFKSMHVTYPIIDDNLLKIYFQYFHKCGFIDKPTK